MRMLLLLALLCAPLLYSQADPVLKPAPKAGQADIADGEEAFEAGRMQDAVDAFTRALKAQPKNDEVLAYRAAAYVALGKTDDALADVEEAIKLETTFSLAWNTRGYLRWLRGDFKGAVADYTAAIAYGADDRRVDTGGRAQMYQNRGVAWQDAGNTDRALLDFDSCIALQPQNPAFYENRGLIYVDKQLFDVAFKDFDRALELDGKNARGYVNRAWAARLMGDFEQAVRDYSQALRLKPDYGQALIGRGYAWIGWERPELAKKDFEAAGKLEGFQAAGLVGLGEIELLARNFDSAEKLFDESCKLEPSSSAAWQGYLRVLMSRKDVDVPLIRQVAGLVNWHSKESPSMRLLVGSAYAKVGDLELAIAHYSIGLETEPMNASLRVGRLRAHAKRGDFQLAQVDAMALSNTDNLVGSIEMARVHALGLGKAEGFTTSHVVQSLQRAKNLGADLTAIAEDPDFASVKDDPEFKKLVG